MRRGGGFVRSSELLVATLLFGCRSVQPTPPVPPPSAEPTPAMEHAAEPAIEPAPSEATVTTEDDHAEPPVAEVAWAVTPDELEAMVSLAASLPAITRDGRRVAIVSKGSLDWSDVEMVQVWVFEPDPDDGFSDRPTEVLPLLTVGDIRDATEHPTTALRGRIGAQVSHANERLMTLGFGDSVDLEEDYDLVEKGDHLLSRWRYRPYTITESTTDPFRLDWVKGGRVVEVTEYASACGSWSPEGRALGTHRGPRAPRRPRSPPTAA